MIESEKLHGTLRDGRSIDNLVDEAEGRVSRRIYGDPEVFELEQERIFQRAWCYLAHQSEFSRPGDVVTRNLAGEPVVLIMGDDGVIRAFLNSCRHRGMRVCRADRDTDGRTAGMARWRLLSLRASTTLGVYTNTSSA